MSSPKKLSPKAEARKRAKWAAKATQALDRALPSPSLRCHDCGKPVRPSKRAGAPRCPSCRAGRAGAKESIEMSYHPTHPSQGVAIKPTFAAAPYMSPEEVLWQMQRIHAVPEPAIDQRDGVDGRLPQGTRVDESKLFQEGRTQRAANGRPLRELRVGQGVHRPAPSGPPGVRKRGRPLTGDLPAGAPTYTVAFTGSHRLRVWKWNKLVRPIKVSTEDWALLRLAMVGDPELMTAQQIRARLGGGVTLAAVRKRLERARAAQKAAN